MTAVLNDSHSQDLEPRKLAAFVRRWWMVIVSIATGFGALYSTIDKVDALERRVYRLEEMATATYVNSTLACIQSGARGCVTFERLERGDVPDLELPTLKKGK
jgi:hypothetical protein